MDCAFGVLAGGLSSRMGRDKAPILLRRVLDRLGAPALISAKDARLAAFGRVVPDVLTARCPLAGIHALLLASPHERLFVCACDMPYVSLPLVRHLLAFDAEYVLPVTDEGEEPLHAVYSRACVPAIERVVREGRLRTSGIAELVRTERVKVDPRDWPVDGRSPFANVNTPEELDALL